MSHRRTGLYTILESPAVYSLLQAILGAPAARQRFVSEFVVSDDLSSVLDVGCGPGSLLELLPERVQYTGYDPNLRYILAARRRYGDRGLFFCARAGQEPLSANRGGVGLVVASALLHHLADDDADRLARFAHRTLPPGGSFVSIDCTLHEGQSPISRMLARLDRGREVRSPEAYRSLLEPYFEHVSGRIVTNMLRVPYSHFIMKATKRM